VLVGGSFIACEVAASLTSAGKSCTLVMQEELPLSLFDQRGTRARVSSDSAAFSPSDRRSAISRTLPNQDPAVAAAQRDLL
jgi:hypothetical protein